MAELKLRILLGDLEDDVKTLLPKKHEHDNAQTIKQLQHRISVIKSQLQSMRKPVKKQSEKKSEKIVEKAVEITPKADRYNKRSGVDIPIGENIFNMTPPHSNQDIYVQHQCRHYFINKLNIMDYEP